MPYLPAASATTLAGIGKPSVSTRFCPSLSSLSFFLQSASASCTCTPSVIRWLSPTPRAVRPPLPADRTESRGKRRGGENFLLFFVSRALPSPAHLCPTHPAHLCPALPGAPLPHPPLRISVPSSPAHLGPAHDGASLPRTRTRRTLRGLRFSASLRGLCLSCGAGGRAVRSHGECPAATGRCAFFMAAYSASRKK